MKLATVEKKTFLAGLQCTLTSSCAKNAPNAFDIDLAMIDFTIEAITSAWHNVEKTYESKIFGKIFQKPVQNWENSRSVLSAPEISVDAPMGIECESK